MERRAFLKSSAGALSAGVLPRIRDAVTTRILLWVRGGMAATETFDPKEYVPYRRGLETGRVVTTARPVSTALRGVEIGSGLERIGERLGRATVIRSFVPDGTLPLAHGVHQRRWMEWFGGWGAPMVTPGNFEQGCAAALRAAAEGERTIVVPFRFLPFAEWDTHAHGAARMPSMKAALDGPVAGLIDGLEQRGLLTAARVLLASEFSRGPDAGRARLQKPEQYGVHAHAAKSSSVVIFGGASSGRVIGETAEDGSGRVVRDPVDFARLQEFCV